MQRQRVCADYLQTSAVIGEDWGVRSAVNDPNEPLLRPGHGYVLDGERWQLLQALPQTLDPRDFDEDEDAEQAVEELYVAKIENEPDEVVIAVGPAFGDAIRRTINGLAHADVLVALEQGVREAGGRPRLVRVRRAADVAFIGHDGAALSGSGVAVGIQSKGTAVIHRADLEPLDNLELFGMSPLYTLESYRAIGRNAAGYALGQEVGPVPTMMDNFARAKLIVKTTLLHARETAAVAPGARPSSSGAALVGRLLRGPGHAADAPVLRRVPFDDHPRVLSQALRRRLAKRVREAGDELRARLVVHPEVEQLDPDQRHRYSLVVVPERRR